MFFTHCCEYRGCNEGADDRLSSASADFVDVMLCSRGLLAIADDVGHVNFWMNDDGAHQPQ